MIPFVRNVLKNLFTGPATRNYPAAPSPTVEGGRFRLDGEGRRGRKNHALVAHTMVSC